MPRLSQIIAARSEVRVSIGDVTLTLGFRPAAFTPSFLQEEASLSEALPKLLTDWDLEDDEGELVAGAVGPNLVPITKANLEALGLPVLRQIYAAVEQSAFPNRSSSTT